MSEETYFSSMKYRFQPIPDDGRIETVPFLNACGEILPFFDILGSSVSGHVKSEINGNIKKLRKKFWKNPEKFKTLQAMVEHEIEKREATNKYYRPWISATDSLLWLKRALTFIRVLLEQVLSKEPDLSKCAKVAYERSLKKYHGWLWRKTFALDLKMAMTEVRCRREFLFALAFRKDSNGRVILEHMQQALDELAPNLDVLNSFYLEKGEDKEGKE